MCCFSKKVESVRDTNIFARASRGSGQFIVYEMNYQAAEDLAMILPIPVPRMTLEKDVRFISLEKYPQFFGDMSSSFPVARGKTVGVAGGFGGGGGPAPKLTVVNVGSFEASFVPRIQDFERLDERFRLPAGTWDNLPRYKQYGFAVFKLKHDATTTHPMAFEFPRLKPERLFFPTVHIHDGVVHEEADFNHSLYAQFDTGRQLHGTTPWKESFQPAEMFLKMEKCNDLVDGKSHAYRRELRGRRTNDDIYA